MNIPKVALLRISGGVITTEVWTFPTFIVCRPDLDLLRSHHKKLM